MATFDYNKDLRYFLLKEKESDYQTHHTGVFNYRMVVCFPYNRYDNYMVNGKLLGYTGQENVNPYIIKFNNSQCSGALYFGEDMPVVRFNENPPKRRTKEYKKWVDSPSHAKTFPYYYVEVQEPDKLFNLYTNYGQHDKIFMLYDTEDVKIFKLDYTEEELAVIVREREEREKRQKELARQREAEREYRKTLPGYCDCCGEPHASYVANPYYYEMYGQSRMQWLCCSCYTNMSMDV